MGALFKTTGPGARPPTRARARQAALHDLIGDQVERATLVVGAPATPVVDLLRQLVELGRQRHRYACASAAFRRSANASGIASARSQIPGIASRPAIMPQHTMS